MYLWHICHIDLELFPFSYLFWDKTDVRSRSRMERFLAIKNKASRNVTALQRQTEFRGWTHVSGEKLFCTPCNLVLDHSRKSSVESHCKSVRHKNALSRQAEEGSDGPSSKRQKTLNLQPQPQSLPLLNKVPGTEANRIEPNSSYCSEQNRTKS